MKWLAGTMIAAALAWGGFWGVSAHATKSAAEAWFAERRAEGWQADYGAISVRGFPNRVDLTIEDVALSDPDRALGWEIPALQMLQLVYRPNHAILAFADSQTITRDGAAFAVESTGLRASLSFLRDQTLNRAGVEAEALNVTGPDGGLALAGLRGSMVAVPDQVGAYQLGVTAEATAGATTGIGDGLTLRADIAFDAPWRKDMAARPTPQPTRITLDQAQFKRDAMFIRLAGDMRIGPRGAVVGDLTLRAENWRAALDAAVAAGQLPEAAASAAGDVLALVSSLSGNRNALDLPLRFEDGRTRIGPLPVGSAPRIVLP